MGLPWRRRRVQVNGHHAIRWEQPDPSGFVVLPSVPTIEPQAAVRRESRRCEEWYVGPGIDRGELEGNARRCFERTRIPQRVHGHPFGHLCTSSCRVVAGEEIE